MQFELKHREGTDYSIIRFETFAHADIAVSLKRLGGVEIECLNWEFPSFITSQVIREVIRNTCFVCGGLMKDSTALQNTLVSSNDFGNDAGQRGTTQSRTGKARMLNVRKCSNCGHSHT